ncbi:hypothetical protein [Reichenbachiella sp.]|uniref:hypothetical protein n=1 Tax=Reichenbachiella sp. TaxID=2184521 RepID=UPI003B5C2600
MTHTRLTGKICFKRSFTGMVLYVQEATQGLIPHPFSRKHWRKATPEDISELEIHSMISEV